MPGCCLSTSPPSSGASSTLGRVARCERYTTWRVPTVGPSFRYWLSRRGVVRAICNWSMMADLFETLAMLALDVPGTQHPLRPARADAFAPDGPILRLEGIEEPSS